MYIFLDMSISSEKPLWAEFNKLLYCLVLNENSRVKYISPAKN